MSAPRYHPAGVEYWMIGSKCVDDQLLLTPSPFIRFLIMLWLSRMQTLHDVEVVAFVFMGNHFHIVFRLRRSRLPAIMRDFKAALAKSLNAALGREGTVWMRRYDDKALLNEASVDTRVHYVHANPVRAGLVGRALEYPGISSWRAYVEDLDSITETWFDEVGWRAAGAKEAERAEYTRTATVRISRPPSWEGLSTAGRRGAVAACVARMDEEERRAAAEREPERPRAPSGSWILKVNPRSRPERPKRTKPSRSSWPDDEEMARFREAYREVMLAYRVASDRYLATGILGAFPAGTYPPRLMYALLET